MPVGPKIFRDGFLALMGGVDSSRSPSLLQLDQAAWAGNCIFRYGFPATRPRFFQQPVVSPNNEIADWIASHTIQGSTVFAPKYRDAVIVASIGGRIFEIRPMEGFAVFEITPTFTITTVADFTVPNVGSTTTITVNDATKVQVGLPILINGGRFSVAVISGSTLTVRNLDAPIGVISSGAVVLVLDVNSATLPRAWFQQAEIFLIIQDNQRRAIIYDGAVSFRSDITKQQVPTGSKMAYGKGRLWVAVTPREFSAGDIVGGGLHEPQYTRIDNLLYFTENTFLAGGGNFSVPLQSGDITAMVFMPVLDTSTGNGTLLIGTERAIFSVNASEDRDTWANTQNPLQTIVSIGNGPVGHYFITQTTNSDIFYRSRDGIRSFYVAMRQFTNSWGSTPISTELDQVLPFDDPFLIQYGSMIQFNNRLLFTLQPVPGLGNAYHRGLGVLDFNPISSMRIKTPPAYDGIWTGFQPILLFKGDFSHQERAFSWARNADGLNELWEFGTTTSFDNTDSRISSFIETRAMSGREAAAGPTQLKRIESVEIWVDQIRGQVDFTLLYRPDQHPCWITWGRAQSVCSDWRECLDDMTGLCTTPTTFRPTYKTRLNFGQPADTDLAVDDKPGRLCYEAQFRLDWIGHCRVRKFVVRFVERDDEHFPIVA